jgi:hypothetical protein
LAERVGVIIMHGQERGGIFEPVRAGEMKMTARDVEAYLESRGYGYRKNVVDLQFGQPFRTIEAIHEFLSDKAAERHEAGRMTADMESAGPDEDEEGEGETDLDLLISSAEERIIKTKRYDYPYYLPRNLNTAVFIVGTRR